MITLREAAHKLNVAHTTIARKARKLGIDTSDGISDADYRKIETELKPRAAEPETLEIVYLEPEIKLNLPTLKPIENTIVPVITDEQVEAVRAYVDNYQEQVRMEIDAARRELEETRKRADEMELEAYRLTLLREKQAEELRKIRIKTAKARESLGKSSSDVQGGV